MHLIPKHQQGGFAQFMTEYKPVQVQAPTQASSGAAQRAEAAPKKAAEKKEDKLGEKDFFAMVKDLNGLPNEMGAIVKKITRMFQDRKLLGDDYIDLATEYTHILESIRQAQQNKAHYDDAYKKVQEKGSITEPAIAANGDIVVQTTDGQLDSVSVEKYLANPEVYKAISVSQLMNLRAYSPDTAGNQEIFTIAQNSVGIDDFSSVMEKLKMNLGSTEYNRSGIVTVKDQQLHGFEILQQLKGDPRLAVIANSISVDGLYKYNLISQDQKNQIQYTLNYALSVLPTRIKTWAALKTGEPDKNKAAQALILNYLLGKETVKNNMDLNVTMFKDDSDKSGKGKGKGENEKEADDQIKAKWLNNVTSGKAGYERVSTFSTGKGFSFQVNGVYYRGLFDKNTQSPVNNLNLKSVLNNTGLLSASAGSVFFGRRKMSDLQTTKIALIENGGTRANLPAILVNGEWQPDFRMFDAYNKIIDKINFEGISDFEERERAIKNAINESDNQDLKDLVNGKFSNKKLGAFFITSGVMSEDTFEELGLDPKKSNEHWLFKYDKNSGGYKDYLNNMKQYVDKDASGDLYVSTVFIPLNMNRNNSVMASGQTPSETVSKDLEAESQIKQRVLRQGTQVKGTGINALGI